MSGGHFNYLDSQLKSEIFGWTDQYSNVFEDKQISALVWDILDLIHEFDYYKSADSGRDDYIEAKNTFKKKWLSDNNAERTKMFIDEALADVKRELYETFDIDDSKNRSE